MKVDGKEATVIHPPVDTELFTPTSTEERKDYFLTLSAFAPYKRLDLAVEAFNQLGMPFFVIGEGQDEKRLKEMAKPNIHFEGMDVEKKLINKAQSVNPNSNFYIKTILREIEGNN